jgi:putative ubiquitin-RnfH superfamily antitoxin RatB of RatAB toxin-antitoxin module
MGDAETITVEVVYALPERQELIALKLPPGSSAMDAVKASSILDRHQEIDLQGKNRIGVFGRAVKPEQPLRDGDRIEIYRPLIADPKAVRKERAAAGKGMKKGTTDTSD